MTDQQIQIIQRSFQIIIDQKDLLAETFLSGLKRSLKSEMIPSDPMWFCRYFMQTVAVCVRGIARWEQLSPMLSDLGHSYLAGKIKLLNPDSVRASFMGAVQKCLGREYTSDVRLVWNIWYDMVSGKIIEGSGERRNRKSRRSVQSLVQRIHMG